MPPDKSAQSAPQGESSKPDKSGAGGIDLGKILLPKKDAGPSKDSAQRINAGALLESEQGATLPPPSKPAPAAPLAPDKPKKETTSVSPIETYQGDIEGLVQSKNVSVLSIAAAEAARRESQPQIEANVQKTPIDFAGIARKGAMILGGLALLVGAGGVLWLVLRPEATVEIQAPQASPFIKVDDTKVLTLPAGVFSHANFIKALADQRDKVALSLGLIERLELVAASTTPAGQTLNPITVSEFLNYLSPNVPDTLLRALKPTAYLFGVHSYDGNQPFLILQVDSYEAAYAGMLSWEHTMSIELADLFIRPAPVHLEEIRPAPVATSTPDSIATSTATSTADSIATTTATSTPPAPMPVFVDAIVENHDARVIQSQSGDILLLWTFVNRNILVITTNESTLREIISRLADPSIVPTP
jgi:hypothetical protein